MGVDDDPRGDPEGVAEDDVGRLPADAGQAVRASRSARDLAAVVARRAPRPSPTRFFALARKKPVEWIRASTSARSAAGQRRRVGEAGEEGGGDQVDPGVGALGREDRRDEELIRARWSRAQRAVGVEPLQGPDDLAAWARGRSWVPSLAASSTDLLIPSPSRHVVNDRTAAHTGVNRRGIWGHNELSTPRLGQGRKFSGR